MKQELVTKGPAKALVDASAMANMAWGSEEVEASDIRVPRIFLQQALSEMVAQKKSQPGDIIDSITGEKLADDKTNLAIVPIYIFKDWRIEEKINGKFEFVRQEPYTPASTSWPREYKDGAKEMRNVLGINVLCMLEKDLNDPSAIPCLVTFRMTGFKTGQDISTLATRAKQIGKPVAHFTINLGCEFVKNDKGNFYVFKMNGASPTKDFDKCSPRLFKWYETFKAGRVKIDQDLTSDETVAGGATDTSNVANKY